jgi:hypothetical protein
MARIVWIASYPKSGNTWLRFLACNLVFGAVNSAEALHRFAPDLHELDSAFQPPDRFLLMKTHFTYSPALRFSQHTAAAIYVVRDPADVMLSNYHYGQRSGAVAVDPEAAFIRYVDSFIASRGDPRWIQLGMGTWEENVKSWIGAAQPFPVLRIRYEDMQGDAAKIATQMCRTLGITRSTCDIDKAVEGAAFERMRQIEEADIRDKRVGIFYKPYLQQQIDAGLRFMREGRSGEAIQMLSDNQRRRFNETFGAIRSALGYRELAPSRGVARNG